MHTKEQYEIAVKPLSTKLYLQRQPLIFRTGLWASGYESPFQKTTCQLAVNLSESRSDFQVYESTSRNQKAM